MLNWSLSGRGILSKKNVKTLTTPGPSACHNDAPNQLPTLSLTENNWCLHICQAARSFKTPLSWFLVTCASPTQVAQSNQSCKKNERCTVRVAPGAGHQKHERYKTSL